MKYKPGFFVLLLFLFSCSETQQKPPNIILIMADDLGYADISCFGSEYIYTPILDKMASEGIKFTDYHSNGPVCTPTRAALMTGNYQQKAGLEGVIYAAMDKRIYGLSSKEKTIAEYFKSAGYVTGAFGKWHLGYKPKYNPTLHGFDEFYGYVSGNVDYISHRDGIGLYDWWHNTDTCYDKGYVTDLITDRALEFLDKHSNKPFFLYLPHEAPHYPYQGRNDKADRLVGVKFQAHGSRSDKKEAYKEMVEIMDENIGRVFKKLQELKINDNTLVVFCSDNGATNMGNNGELRGFKTSLWEGGHRVPAMAWYPSKISAGILSDVTLLSMDWLPTLLSFAGIKSNNNFDGQDMTGVLLGSEKPEERALFWRYRKQVVARKGDWKYIRVANKEYLFDLNVDVRENNNLIDGNTEKANELKVLLQDWEAEIQKFEQQTN